MSNKKIQKQPNKDFGKLGEPVKLYMNINVYTTEGEFLTGGQSMRVVSREEAVRLLSQLKNEKSGRTA